MNLTRRREVRGAMMVRTIEVVVVPFKCVFAQLCFFVKRVCVETAVLSTFHYFRLALASFAIYTFRI